MCLEGLFNGGSSGAKLIKAAAEGDAAAVGELLQAGAPLAAKDSDGMTALHRAAIQDQAEVCRLLLDAGANPDCTQDGTLWTPLVRCAVREGSGACLRACVGGCG